MFNYLLLHTRAIIALYSSLTTTTCSNNTSARPFHPYLPLWPRSSTKDRHCARTTRSRTARSPVAPNKPGLAVIPNQPSPTLQASVSLSIHHLRCRPVVSLLCRPLGGACCSVLGVLCQAPLPLATQLSPALLPTSWYLAFAICTAALSPPLCLRLLDCTQTRTKQLQPHYCNR